LRRLVAEASPQRLPSRHKERTEKLLSMRLIGPVLALTRRRRSGFNAPRMQAFLQGKSQLHGQP
jgi:hypothetical protein